MGPLTVNPKNPLGTSAGCFENNNCNWEDFAYSSMQNLVEFKGSVVGSEKAEADSDLLTLKMN